jgi:hypothetical protein
MKKHARSWENTRKAIPVTTRGACRRVKRSIQPHQPCDLSSRRAEHQHNIRRWYLVHEISVTSHQNEGKIMGSDWQSKRGAVLIHELNVSLTSFRVFVISFPRWKKTRNEIKMSCWHNYRIERNSDHDFCVQINAGRRI